MRGRAVLVIGILVATVGVARPAAALDDTTPPVLVALSISPSSVDASGGDQTVTLTAHLADDLAGFEPAPGSSAFGSFGFVSSSQTRKRDTRTASSSSSSTRSR